MVLSGVCVCLYLVVVTGANVGEARSREETKEEKAARKAAIKAARSAHVTVLTFFFKPRPGHKLCTQCESLLLRHVWLILGSLRPWCLQAGDAGTEEGLPDSIQGDSGGRHSTS